MVNVGVWSSRGGVPLSVTLTVITFAPTVPLPGVHEITPEEGSMVMPEGGLTRENVRVFAGRSASDADAWTPDSATPHSVLNDAGTVSTGATFTSATVITMSSKSSSVPSDTTTRAQKVPGPWSSVGVQVNAPVPVMAAPSAMG